MKWLGLSCCLLYSGPIALIRVAAGLCLNGSRRQGGYVRILWDGWSKVLPVLIHNLLLHVTLKSFDHSFSTNQDHLATCWFLCEYILVPLCQQKLGNKLDLVVHILRGEAQHPV